MKRLVFALVSVFLVLATILTVSYAWFINSDFQEPEISGYSYAAYFASGDGSEEKPYTITNKRHLYNLAWLQFLGNFNELNDDGITLSKQYYFQISPTVKEIDMTGYPLPPIGTETYPFVGVFNGNGCVVKNLDVTNNFNDFEDKHPKSNKVTATAIAELNIIGMFGVVGNYNTMYNISSYVSSIQDFYLDDITISSYADESLVGLLAGYVAESGNIKNIGVHYSKFKLASGIAKISDFDNISNYALIGDYDSEKIGWEDKPSAGGGSEDGIGYGGSLNFLEIMQRMNYITTNNWASPSLTYKPEKDESSFPNSKNYMSLVIKNELTQNYYSSNTVESVPVTNIGYYTGQDAKIVGKQTTEQIIYSDMYIKDGDSVVHATEKIKDPTTIVDFDIYEKDSGANDVLYKTLDENIKEDVLEILGNETNLLYSIRFNGQIETNNWIKVENANVIGYENTTITIPPKSVWFVAQETGYAKIVFGAFDSSTRAPSFYRLERKEENLVKDSDGKIINPYYSELQNGVTAQGITNTFITEVYENQDSTGKKYYSYNKADSSAISSELVFSTGWYDSKLTEDRLYYMQIPLVKGYEYAFGNPNGGGGRILYMDIGQNAAGDGGTTEKPTYTGNLSSIDFVTAIGSTLDDISSSSYVSSNVLFALSNVENIDASTADVVFYFRRKKFSSGEYTDVVLYYIDPRTLDSNGDPTNESNGLKLTPSGTGSKAHASSTKCNNYVGGSSNDEEIISSTTTAYNNLNAAVSAGTISNNAESLALINELESCLSDWESLDDTSSASITTAQITALLITANNQYDAAHIKLLIDSISDNLTAQTITSSDETSIISAYNALRTTSTDVKTLVGDQYISKCNSSYELLQNAYVTVTFHVEDDTTQIKMLPTATLLESKAPTIDTELYDFAGWYTDSAFTNSYAFGNAVGSQSIDLYAKVSQKTIVVFKLNGVELSRVTKSSGSTLNASDFPTVDNDKYYFNGWYDEVGNEYTTGSTVSGNVILSADVDNKYLVTFVYNNGSSNTNAYADKTGIVSEPTNPTHSNSIATFGGWFSNEALTQQFDFTSSINSNITLYAKWTYEAEVVFNLNGGNISGSTDEVVIAVDSTTGIPVLPNEELMSNGDLSFGGWYLNEECTTPFASTAAVTTSTTTVYAKWIEEAGVTVYFKIGYRFNNSNEAEAKYLTIPAIDSNETLLVSIDDLKRLVLEHAGQNDTDWRIGTLFETWFNNEIDLSTETNTYMTNGYLDLSKLGVEGSDTIDGQSGAAFYYVTINFVAA